MSLTNPQKLTYAELARLAPEPLPRRLLLSSTASPAGNDSDTVVFYACQATHSEGTTGLLGTGLLAEAPSSTLTCVPGTVVHQHS